MTSSQLATLKTQANAPPYSTMTAAAAAAAISALTIAQPVTTFGSFRTLAVLLTATEYNTLRATLDAAVAAAPTNYLLADMRQAMLAPGGSDGSGGGLNFADPAFVAQLAALSSAGGSALAAVPAKVAAYASKPVSWCRTNGLPALITAAQITAARSS
jgi:hypothetical protein